MITATLLTLCLTGAPDVPDAIIAGVAMRETGTVWRGRVVRAGAHLVGAAGEVSAWQLSPGVISGLHASLSRARSDSRYAEACARRWLAHLYAVTHSWSVALAAYHRGLRATHSKAALEYSSDVLNLSALYQP